MATITERLAHLETLRNEAEAEAAEVNKEIADCKFFLANDNTLTSKSVFQHRLWLAEAERRRLAKEIRKLNGEIKIARGHVYPPLPEPLIS